MCHFFLFPRIQTGIIMPKYIWNNERRKAQGGGADIATAFVFLFLWNLLERALQQLPELWHCRNLATLLRCVRVLERRAEAYDIEPWILRQNDRALQSGMDNAYRSLCSELTLVDVSHDLYHL